jgi:hypothetical protein
MVVNLGDQPAGTVMYVPFSTYNSSGASVTITGLAVTDIEIYKNGSVTQRASDAGYVLLDTDGIDFDGITGIHGFSVDLGDNTTAGFYAAGSAYWLVVSAITVDSQTVNFVYYFTIDRDNVLRPTTAGRTLDVTTTGEAGLDYANINFPVGAIPALGIIDNGTAQSASSTTLVLRSAAAFANDEVIGASLLITGGSAGVGQSRLITDYVNSTDTATVEAWTTTPTGTITYVIFGTAAGSGASGLDAAGVRTALGMSSANLDTQLSTIDTVVDAILVDTGTTLDGRIPAALVSGRMDASVGAMAANVITAAATATDFTTEVTSGLATAAGVTSATGSLATAANLATVAGYLDTEIAAILADTNELQTDWANGGRLDVILDARSSQATVDTIAGYLDTEVSAIKTKTDQLTFGVTNVLNANITHVIADAVQESGSNTTEWGGAP